MGHSASALPGVQNPWGWALSSSRSAVLAVDSVTGHRITGLSNEESPSDLPLFGLPAGLMGGSAPSAGHHRSGMVSYWLWCGHLSWMGCGTFLHQTAAQGTDPSPFLFAQPLPSPCLAQAVHLFTKHLSMEFVLNSVLGPGDTTVNTQITVPALLEIDHVMAEGRQTGKTCSVEGGSGGALGQAMFF